MVKFRCCLLFVPILVILLGACFPISASAGYTSQKLSTPDVFILKSDVSCLTEENYWQLVRETRQTLVTPPDDFERVMNSLIQRWLSARLICLDDHSPIYLENSVIVSSLRNLSSANSEPEEMARLAGWLETMETTRSLVPAAADPQAQDKLDKVLSQPEFQWKSETPNPIIRWINQLILHFLEWLNNLTGGNSLTIDGPFGLLIKLALPFIAILLLGLLAVYTMLSLKRSFSAAEVANSFVQPGDEHLDTDNAFARGETAAQAGDYRSALRYLYLSVLLSLDERGFLRFDKTRTNREYITSLTTRNTTNPHRMEIQKISGQFISLVETFEEVWYGFHPVDQALYENFRQRVKEIRISGSNSRNAV